MRRTKVRSLPVIDPKGSDSAILDNTLEFLMMNDIELAKAVMITIPEALEEFLTGFLKKRFLSLLRYDDGTMGWASSHFI